MAAPKHRNLLSAEEGIDLQAHLSPLVELAEGLRLFGRQLDRALEKRAEEEPACRLFMEIPGVGPLCACPSLRPLMTPTAFVGTMTSRPTWGWFHGGTNRGSCRGPGVLQKPLSTLTRQHLVAAALNMRIQKKDCALRDWEAALRERVGSGRARVALARKLAVLMLCMWKSGACFEAYPARGSDARSHPERCNPRSPVQAERRQPDSDH